MCAMIPMLRTRSRPTRVFSLTAIASDVSPLPAVVREGLVGLRHPVDVVLALVGAALLVERVHDLAGEPLREALLAALARERDEPAHGEVARAALRHLDGNLVVGAADAARANLEHRCQRLDGLVEHLDGRPAATLAHDRERVV